MCAKKIGFKVLMVAAIALAWCGLSFAASKEPVKIGLVTSMTGSFALNGEQIQRAIQFAVKEANQGGGVDGRNVEVMKLDDESTPEGARRSAEKVVRAGYNLLIGPISTPMGVSISQNLDRWDALFISISSKSDKLRGEGCKPRMFFTIQSDAMDLAMMDDWLATLKEKKISIIAADYLWGRDSAANLKKVAPKIGKEIKLELYAPVGTKDFAPYISQLSASAAEAVWVTLIGRDTIAFAKQAKEFGLMKKVRIIGHSFLLNHIIDASGSAAEGMWGNIQYDAANQAQRNKQFVAAWKKEFKREPTQTEGQAYNGIQALFFGIKTAGSVKPEAIAKALSGATLDTIYGKVKIRAEDHQMLLPNYVGQVKNIGGQYKPVVELTFGPSVIPPASSACRMK